MKTILVTGSTDGIGKATAIALARRGHRLIVHGRNQPRVQAALAEVLAAAPGATLLATSFDLGRLASVRTGAADVMALLGGAPLHALINNAGIFAGEREVTGDGNELSFQVNHLAAVLLTELLLPALLAAAPGRVINVASIAHTRGEIHRGDLTLGDNFTGYAAYAQSKLANVLHARALAACYQPEQLVAFSLHPGVISTKLLKAGFAARGADVESGATTSVRLATAEAADLAAVPSGSYVSQDVVTPPSHAAQDDELRAWLWHASRELAHLPPRALNS